MIGALGSPSTPSPVRALPLPRLLDEALRQARPLARAVLLPAAVVTVLFQVAVVVSQFVYASRLAEGDFVTGFAFLGLMLVFSLGAMFPYLPVAVAAAEAAAGRAVDVRATWRFSLRPRTLGTMALVALCLVGSYACCFVPVLYVAPLLSLAVPAMVLEGRFGTAAIARSAELTRFNPGKTFLGGVSRAFVVLLAGSLVSMLLAMPAQLPFQVAVLLRTFRGVLGSEGAPASMPMADPGLLWLQIPGAVLGGVAATFAGVYGGCAVALLFLDFRRRREAPDLEAALDALDPIDAIDAIDAVDAVEGAEAPG